MKIKELVAKLDRYMTIVSADEAGRNLIVGNNETDVTGIVLSFSVNEEIIKRAVGEKANVIICYNQYTLSATDNIVMSLIKNDIALVTVKLDLDICDNGYENILLDKLKFAKKDILDVTFKEKCYKLVSCIPILPEDYTTQIRKAIGTIGVNDGVNGAGYIGTYSEVSDCMYGHQWFVTMPGANPFIGEIGDLSKVDVERFEMIIPEHQIDECIAKLWEIHPYEEVEYDVYPVMETRNHKGSCRLGEIEGLSKEELVKNLNSILNTTDTVSNSKNETVSKLAVCGEVCNEMTEKLLSRKVNAVITYSICIENTKKLEDNGIAIIKVNEAELKKLSLEKLSEFLSETEKIISLI